MRTWSDGWEGRCELGWGKGGRVGGAAIEGTAGGGTRRDVWRVEAGRRARLGGRRTRG